MAQKRGGCGCALAVLVVVLLLVALLVRVFFWSAIQERWTKRLPPPSGKELQVHVLDVGLGDSILIIAPSGRTVLIDAGVPGSGKKILDAMRRNGVDHLDLLVATHEHADHIGGVDELLKSTPVGAVFDNGVEQYPTKEFQSYRQALKGRQLNANKPAPGQTFDLGDGAVLTVLAPIDPPFTAEELRQGGNVPNANSVVMRLDYGGFSMLLPGDAEAATEERLINKGARLQATVLKVAHHGSKYATTEDLLRRGQFKAAIISTGADNRYGLPGQETLDRLKAAGVRLYRTDIEGEVTVTTKGGEDFKIQTAREPKQNEDIWAGRAPLRDDRASRGFLDFGDLPPAPRPTPERAKTNANAARH